jgi:methylmalonyl-CoA mutase
MLSVMSANPGLSLQEAIQPVPEVGHRLRFVTATSLFDGHDASINVMRRILQASGAEVIHLGHNRSVREIVDAAVEEDAAGIAVSSYQGGHTEFFKYMIDMLRERNRAEIRVFGGGGGVIVKREIQELEAYGVARIYSPRDGQVMGLQGMINDMLERTKFELKLDHLVDLSDLRASNRGELARLITAIENQLIGSPLLERLEKETENATTVRAPVIGITGTGGSGKSSLTDELVLRWRMDHSDALQIAILAIDPSRKKTGGALLGDRIRMNAIEGNTVFMRSLATRSSNSQIPTQLLPIIRAVQLAGFDLVIVETPGIGQGDSEITSLTDLSLYVMTPEFGAASQLEKIDMLDHADFVAINKFDRKGGEDAVRDVRKQLQRNRSAFDQKSSDMPAFGTVASHFNDAGVSQLYMAMHSHLETQGMAVSPGSFCQHGIPESDRYGVIVPVRRRGYLGEISENIRQYRLKAESAAAIARQCQQLKESAKVLKEAGQSNLDVQVLAKAREKALDNGAHILLQGYRELEERYAVPRVSDESFNSEGDSPVFFTSLSGTRLPKISLPRYTDDGDRLRWLMLENVPGSFPFTAGVFPLKRTDEDPTRMFAGEGDAFRTNRRFKLLSKDTKSKRLSTAFDSVTLYGSNPDPRPDIYGKVGTSGVSIATLEDMEVLYDGFDLCDPLTSVSMTINGPAPVILAFFLNTAIEQQMERYRSEYGQDPDSSETDRIRDWALENVRGTVQADILKEDQGQNTCLFSTEFSLRMMGDIQQYFIDHQIRNFYSVSISGYHIAEAGANPISQLAFTLANGFTYVEAYLARGMKIDDFAANLSFFFSNGMDPEYTVMGRVARRIWAVAMRERYGASERSQKLKYHIQTSGRSLHAQEMSFNDIRTTLQALIAIYDNCNSLHTNAHDEAITTPSESSVRRALAIQMIINREWGLAKSENSNQGSFAIEELTDLVEEAVLSEFERISDRGGVLGAMETGYQRGKIQEQSLYYEQLKHDGSFPIVGVNTFLGEQSLNEEKIELSRGTDQEKDSQLKRLSDFHQTHEHQAELELDALKRVALNGENTFEQLMSAVRCCSLGQITSALFDVGGKYRRNM